MFTGIVTDIGHLAPLERIGDSARLTVQCRLAADGIIRGESICVSGVCLTVEASDRSTFTVTASPETLRRTTLGRLAAGGPVNLERALTPESRLGGHLVQGHVDGVGRIRRIRPDGVSRVVSVDVPASILAHVVVRGSVAVDGVSLTVTASDARGLSVTLIPATLETTTLGERRAGDPVNLEADLISKYVARHLEVTAPEVAGRDRVATWLESEGGS
jgi:riboflavin synthase